MSKGKYIRTIEHNKNISESRKGEKHHYFGKHLSEEHRKKQSNSLQLRKQKLGYVNSEETKLKISKTLMGHKVSEETRKKMSKNYKYHAPRKGIKTSTETKRKQRLSHIKLIELNYGISHPNYNPKACEYFKQFDKENNTKGQYAMYGGGEHYIKELGYWVDYFNPKLKLIIEYDENNHYEKNGNLKQRDIVRQHEIQLIYPDYEFRRITESKWAIY